MTATLTTDGPRSIPSDIVARVRQAMADDKRAMTVQIARQLGIAEADVMAALPEGQAVELDASRWEQIIRDFESLEMVHVICTNNAVTCEVFGQFGNFSTWGDYFNVQTKSLDMHIRYKELQRVFAVEKPSHMDGVNTLSVQFFDSRGVAAFKVFFTFGGKAPAPQRVEQFQQIRDRYRLGHSS